ncbi:MAG: FAD-dependent oxidoreductase [Elusimicrobia bacterium]|nr:FAD-dependent oxidoreductase [Elusimicrobiota bacterium]
MAQDSPRLTRRALLAAGAAAVGAAVWPWRDARGHIEGSLLGPNKTAGHKLRAGSLPAPSAFRKSAVLIAGGGAAGLSAARRLRQAGVEDFLVTELEPQAGGNARWGEGPVSAYPWGAHYLPLPDAGSNAVVELLKEYGVVTGSDAAGRPVFDERWLCHDPEERIFSHGRWESGLYPSVGISSVEEEERGRFEARMESFRRLKTKDGRPAFAVPMVRSSSDPELLALDALSFGDWLTREGFTGERIRWYADYACRDDFGARLESTSAWAGIHYFAARGADDSVLTWPEGNGWLVKRLAEPLEQRLKTGVLVIRVEETRSGVEADLMDVDTGSVTRVTAKSAVIALPRFVAARVVAGLGVSAAFQYAPWTVSNLTLEDPPSGIGAEPAWDNVFYKGESLGYVVATHQKMGPRGRSTVWTHYHAYADGEPAAQRASLEKTPWAAHRDRVLDDLERALPGVSSSVRRLDVWTWGHGMIRPAPGFMFGKERLAALRPRGRIHFGHSDLSGFSLFEEAQYRGIKAAEGALTVLTKGA